MIQQNHNETTTVFSSLYFLLRNCSITVRNDADLQAAISQARFFIYSGRYSRHRRVFAGGGRGELNLGAAAVCEEQFALVRIGSTPRQDLWSVITETPAEIHRGHSGFVGIELSSLGLRQLSKLRAYIYIHTPTPWRLSFRRLASRCCGRPGGSFSSFAAKEEVSFSSGRLLKIFADDACLSSFSPGEETVC